MLVEQAMKWMEMGSTFMYTIAPAPYTPPRTSGTAIRTPPRGSPCPGPREPSQITCSTSARTFLVTVDSTTTPKATQDTPALGGVVERLEETLEEGERNTQHDPSESLTLGGGCSKVLSKGDEHSPEEDSTIERISTAAVREPASCPPQVEMLRHEQEPGCSTLETRRYASDAKSEDVLPSSSVEESRRVWDVARDNETLSYFYHNRLNLVLDSVLPDRAPHIVITLVEETWEDQYTPWQNRVGMQWPGYLTVPQLDMSNGPLHAPRTTPHSFPGLSTHPPSSNGSPPLTAPFVFSPSRFKQLIESASVERLVLIQVVKTLQKAQCKTVFFDASDLARSFRKRYDALPSILSKREPVYTWSDPAEPILLASRRLLGTTILDSVCPFLAPHIVINAPPPQPPQLTENNATPYTQDAGFGQRLIVRSYSVEIINAAKDWDWSSYELASSDVDTVDQLESESEDHSRPGTPVPETPVDGNDRHHFFYARYEDDGQDDIGTVSGASCIYGFDSHIEVEAVVWKLQATSRPMFFIDEDEDELPSLDGW